MIPTRLPFKLFIVGLVVGYLAGFKSCWPLAPAMMCLWYGNVYEAIRRNEIRPLTKFGGARWNPKRVIKKDKNPVDFWLNVSVEFFFASIIVHLMIQNIKIIKVSY